jgi:hypothetical protein
MGRGETSRVISDDAALGPFCPGISPGSTAPLVSPGREPSRAPPRLGTGTLIAMVRYSRDLTQVEGTRVELEEELKMARRGWKHFGKDQLSEQAGQALDDLTAGASSTRVGHTEYLVTEE